MLLPNPFSFLQSLFTELEVFDGQLDDLYLDHICFRVSTEDEYVLLRDQLSEAHELLVESPVGGRWIATFKLSTPFKFRDRSIEVLELPSPKAGSPYPAGYEHVEFVTDRPLEEFINYLEKKLKIDPNKIDGKGMAKMRNRDIRVNLQSGKSVKFHERSLADVIQDELRAGNNFG